MDEDKKREKMDSSNKVLEDVNLGSLVVDNSSLKSLDINMNAMPEKKILSKEKNKYFK